MELTSTSNGSESQTSSRTPGHTSTKRIVYECALVIALAINVVLCGLLALFIPMVALHTNGIIFAGHCFWIGIPNARLVYLRLHPAGINRRNKILAALYYYAIVAASLGIATYSKDCYEPCVAKAHVTFTIISLITLIGGFVILAINFVNLGLPSSHPSNQYDNNQPPSTSSVAINAVVAIFYVFFFCVFIHCIVVYCRIPNTLIGRDNTSLPVQLTQEGVIFGTDQEYNFYHPDVDDVKV
ncbi:uncharacterized protein TRIADDRAFT_57770 [Trichoplax adhaerens]|uniref:Uncharacterized protein n=1 Tax=Trichoplax adhaerens TaxID=10228 RepID=B3S0D1_TRIAD|nr:predicted protein [Trichoplax adhaerens]EDV24359.1 predicted protein [Trichoplax adhaerens]|eukprot:XP_002113885.1 predicted protein [Trichoplax adhaerens]